MSLPVDVLVTEHKLILQAVGLIEREIEQIQNNNAVDHNFIATAVDFFRTYADMFHHCKEEGILFRELSQRQLKDTDQKIMKDLMMEHTFARRTVTALEKANEDMFLDKKKH
jgi:hemerythrin-like domain-containing protein